MSQREFGLSHKKQKKEHEKEMKKISNMEYKEVKPTKEVVTLPVKKMMVQHSPKRFGEIAKQKQKRK